MSDADVILDHRTQFQSVALRHHDIAKYQVWKILHYFFVSPHPIGCFNDNIFGFQAFLQIITHILIILDQQNLIFRLIFILRHRQRDRYILRIRYFRNFIYFPALYLFFGECRTGYRKDNDKASTFCFRMIHINYPTMELYNRINKTQADTCPRQINTGRFRNLIERSEYLIRLSFFNPFTGIFDFQDYVLTIFIFIQSVGPFRVQFFQGYFRHLHKNRFTGSRIFEGIRQEVKDNFFQEGFIKPAIDRFRSTIQGEFDFIGQSNLIERIIDFFDIFADISFIYLQVHATRLVLMQVHQLIDKKQKFLSVLINNG